MEENQMNLQSLIDKSPTVQDLIVSDDSENSSDASSDSSDEYYGGRRLSKLPDRQEARLMLLSKSYVMRRRRKGKGKTSKIKKRKGNLIVGGNEVSDYGWHESELFKRQVRYEIDKNKFDIKDYYDSHFVTQNDIVESVLKKSMSIIEKVFDDLCATISEYEEFVKTPSLPITSTYMRNNMKNVYSLDYINDIVHALFPMYNFGLIEVPKSTSTEKINIENVNAILRLERESTGYLNAVERYIISVIETLVQINDEINLEV